ncbi:hypothetical protein BDV93DRAFT_527889 [Ceratobasidium sp. AG-I]|nr:hypothetical protein BDV93DRAFT_527889 [Ceratobasidium sp. AG-I]
MPDWLAVYGAVTNAATIVDMSYRYRPTETIYGKDAGDILKEVDDILKSSNAVLENHKDILDGDVYEDLRDQYREYHWQMTDEGQGHRAIRNQIIRQSRILSALYASEENRQNRAETLLATVEQYQTNVLARSQAASQARRGRSLSLFPDITNASSEEVSAPKSYSSWFSVFGAGRNQSQSDIESVGSSEAPSQSSRVVSSPSNSMCEDDPYIVVVTYIPDDGSTTSTEGDSGETETSTPGEQLYHRKVTFEGGGKRIDVIDPRRRPMGENMAKMGCSPAGSRIMKAPVPNVSLESAIENFKKMSTSTT